MSDLGRHIERIALALLGEPNRGLSTRDQLRYGAHGSLAIELAGEQAGAWYDHEREEGGGALDLIQRERKCDPKGALAWLRDELGIELKRGNGAGGTAQRRAAVYIYKDEHGEPIYCVSRWAPLKTFTQERYDPVTGKFIPGKGAMKGVRLVPYRLPELLADAAARVWIAEGEKDADRLAGLGLCATTNPGGAGKWPASFGRYLAGRDLVILPDNDQAGRDHARDVMARLTSVAGSVRIVELPALLPKQDVSDWLDHGGTIAQLEKLATANGPDREAASADIKAGRTSADGAALLEDVRAFLIRFISYPSAEASVAHALWIAHAHLMEAWESTPRIAFLSPEPASGKTRALEVTELLVPRPVEAINVSPAYLFRKVASDDGAPTILHDEIDTVFGPKARENEEIRGLINAGHRRGAKTGRCVVRGKIVETEEIDAFCAVALAGLGWLPHTLMTRSVVIRMRPRTPGERIEPYRRRVHSADGLALRARLETWAFKVEGSVAATWPNMPVGIQDRDADVWEALIAAADAAGGDWPGFARQAAVALVAESRDNTPSLGVRLLADLRTVFVGDAMRTNDILIALHALEESPWGDLKGKPLNPRGLAIRLRQYRITSRKVRFGAGTAWGYLRSDFIDSWDRYLSPSRQESGTSGTSGTDRPKAAAGASFGVPDSVPDAGAVPDNTGAVPEQDRRSGTENPRETANVPDVPDVPDLRAAQRGERCAICSGIIVPGDRAEENGLIGHPSCLAGFRSWPEGARLHALRQSRS
jgi:hypothetical protein